jgi:hypothetical protein
MGLLLVFLAGCGSDGGGADSAGTGGNTSESPEAAPSAPTDLGMEDGLDVITIGDSWMNLGVAGIQQSLVAASGRPYRTHGIPGTRLLNEQIPMQYAQAKAEDPDIVTVVMTAGGNDILQVPEALTDCIADWSTTGGIACKAQIDAVAARLETLWAEMAADGVADVVIIGYSRAGGVFAAPIEYSQEVVGQLCDDAPLGCHAIDSDTIIDGDLRDGIHPTDAAFELLGQAIWQLMQDAGVRR